jgi:hypothetical protein
MVGHCAAGRCGRQTTRSRQARAALKRVGDIVTWDFEHALMEDKYYYKGRRAPQVQPIEGAPRKHARAGEPCRFAALRHSEVPSFSVKVVASQHCIACVSTQRYWWKPPMPGYLEAFFGAASDDEDESDEAGVPGVPSAVELVNSTLLAARPAARATPMR